MNKQLLADIRAAARASARITFTRAAKRHGKQGIVTDEFRAVVEGNGLTGLNFAESLHLVQ